MSAAGGESVSGPSGAARLRAIDALIQQCLYGQEITWKWCGYNPSDGSLEVNCHQEDEDAYESEIHPCILEHEGHFQPEHDWLRWGIVKHYSTDLNACFEAQARLIEKVGRMTYQMALGNVLPDIGRWGCYTVDATAEQRCLAMLACLGVKVPE